MLDSVIDLIFSAQPADTVIGGKLVKAATNAVKPELDKKEQKEHDFRVNLREIKSYDMKDNMCWVDYMAWMTLPRRMQKSITDLLDPRSWRGVVFQYSLWEEHEVEVVKYLNPDYVIVITKDTNNKYRLHTIPLYKSYIDWMTPTKFREMEQRISNMAYRTYGMSKDGTVFVLDRDKNVSIIL